MKSKIEGRINKRFCYYTTIIVLFYLNNGTNKSLADDDDGLSGLSEQTDTQ